MLPRLIGPGAAYHSFGWADCAAYAGECSKRLRVSPSVQSPPLLRRKTFRRARRADENPARPWGNSKGRFGRGLGNPHGWILGERKREVPPEEPSGASEVPPQIRFEGASAFGSNSLTPRPRPRRWP